jgi:molybdopterin molybdotransferase
MGGAGAVGGQVMTGMAALERLRRRHPGKIAVWPFEGGPAPVHFVEIWPSLIAGAVRSEGDGIRDRAQVRLLARALSRLPEEWLSRMMGVDEPEEGWILGIGYEDELARVAWPI